MFLRSRQPDPPRARGRHKVHGRPLTGPWPEGHEVVYLGLGCFWAGERRFWDIRGVWTTASGFTSAGTEVVMVVYDPTVVPLVHLLKQFLQGHDAARAPTSGLYASLVVVDDQARAATVRELLAAQRPAPRTRVVVSDDGDGFSYAAADQQQYLAR